MSHLARGSLASLILILVIIAGIAGYIYANLGDREIKIDLTNKPSITIRINNFENISKESYSGHNERKNYVIKEVSEWKNLWGMVHIGTTPKPVLPDINFDNEMIIAVFQGMHSTGGYSIEITQIIEKDKSLEIFIKETSPAPGSVTTQAVTQPYHIVKTKRTDKEIIFR